MRFLFLLVFVFLAKTVCSQVGEVVKDPSDALEDYFELPRETVYLHLNKSSYVVGENLWFKGYVYDRFKSLPFNETSNLYVGIYDEKGKQKDKKLFLVKNGTAHGHFVIDSTFNSGEFYIKAATNWMKNFKEDDSFIQKLHIVDPDDEKLTQSSESKANDVQFLPEGGYLVNDIMNTVGVKALNSEGYGIAIKEAVILDNSGKKVSEFSVERFGHGKFEFMPRFGSSYRASVTFNDNSEQTFPLPTAMMEGINLSVRNNSRQKRIAVIVGTNSYTKSKKPNASYYALIHKNGGSERINFNFKEEETQSGFFLSKERLPPGVNVITIFNEDNKPLVERLFFNSNNLAYPKVNATVIKTTTDSLQIKLGFSEQYSADADLSASILPAGTDAYNHSDNILSTFYLRPYVHGFIENGGYYFKNTTTTKEYELDLLLLNQGWSKYDWKSVFNTSPDRQYEFERGITLDIKLNEENVDGKAYYVFPTRNHKEREVTVEPGKKEFSIGNFFLDQDEEVFIAEKDDKGKLTKPKIYMISKNQNKEDRIVPWPNNYTSQVMPDAPFNIDLIAEDNTIVLDEVVLRQKKLLEKARQNPNVQSFLRRKIEVVDEKTALNFPRLLDLIRSRGYQVIENPANFSVSVSSYRSGRLELFIEGIRQPNLDQLSIFQTEDIESYFFDRNKTVPGVSNGFTESLYIFLRRGGDFLNLAGGKGQRTISSTYKVEKGFEAAKEFYAPLYNTYFSDLFDRYGVVHWEPEIKILNNQGSFKIPNTGLEELKICIEGMDSSGNLYSEIKIIEIDKM
ncbi:hypothetical protein [Maribacter sp. R77961]|uniref:hypothetical protein n=1 Tax=Maribacter sp. R77961 TaxID=3093871 RepID=UPI0037C76E52